MAASGQIVHQSRSWGCHYPSFNPSFMMVACRLQHQLITLCCTTQKRGGWRERGGRARERGGECDGGGGGGRGSGKERGGGTEQKRDSIYASHTIMCVCVCVCV